MSLKELNERVSAARKETEARRCFPPGAELHTPDVMLNYVCILEIEREP